MTIDSLNLPGEGGLILYSKWGLDGSSGQSEYKQISTGGSRLVSDSNLLISSLVQLKQTNESNRTIIWQNPASLSTRLCCLILIEFGKETPARTKRIVDPAVIRTELKLSVKYILFLTMVDGKVVQVLTNTQSSATYLLLLHSLI